MSEEVDIRSLSVTAAAKLLKLSPKTIRTRIRRGLPLVDKRIDLIVYGAWLNVCDECRSHGDTGRPERQNGPERRERA